MVPNVSVPPPGQPAVTTLEYGTRWNGNEKRRAIQQNAILAVGDSFTAGSEVADHESWPAHLERILDQQIINAGVGGYGVDQIVLRAEQLLPLLKPMLLIIGLLDQDILRNQYSRYGQLKPYFTLDGESLNLQNTPVPQEAEPIKAAPSSLWVEWASKSLIADILMAKFSPQHWLPSSSHLYKLVENDPVEVSCKLLVRLMKRTKEIKIPVMLFMQYGSGIVGSNIKHPMHALKVNECARGLGIHVVDELEYLRNTVDNTSTALKDLYVLQADGISLGHMSSTGNEFVANLIFEELKKSGLVK